MMSNTLKATIKQCILLWVYRLAPLIVIACAASISFALNHFGLMPTIIKNAAALSVTGAAISAFLFTMQSILMGLPAKNAYLQEVRKDGQYLLDIHRFCRYSEIAFLVNLIPMLYMGKKEIILNIIVLSIFLGALLFTIWSMYLMGGLLIRCERHANDKTEIR